MTTWRSLEPHMVELQHLNRFPDEARPHFDGRGTRLRIDPAAMSDANDQVHVSYEFAEHHQSDLLQGN
jgi:hypothetical protein